MRCAPGSRIGTCVPNGVGALGLVASGFCGFGLQELWFGLRVRLRLKVQRLANPRSLEGDGPEFRVDGLGSMNIQSCRNRICFFMPSGGVLQNRGAVAVLRRRSEAHGMAVC